MNLDQSDRKAIFIFSPGKNAVQARRRVIAEANADPSLDMANC
jgi:hypothetical protein